MNDAPLVEQITELMMIHNKSDPKAGVQVVSEIDKDGKVKTVPADEKNENSFLKFDKNSSILENFIKNFWSQLKEPTHFRLLRMTFHDYKVNKQAIKDLAEGKKTDAVKEFLKRYEIRPRENKEEQNMNKQETAMAKKETQPQEPLQQSEVQQASQQQQQPQVQQVPQEPQGPRYRYNENMIDWEGLDKIGISKATLEQQGLLDSMLRGYKTNKLVPLTLNIPGVLTAKLDARLSLIPQENGQVGLAVHGIRKEPQLERPYFGFNFSEEDKKNLRETGNMGRAVELNLRGSEYTPCLISIDKNTNELVAVRQEHVYIPQEVSGVRLTDEEIRLLKEGQPVKVEGMISKAGKEFDATLQYSAERRGLEFIFPKNQVFNEKSIGGVPLSPTQIKMLSEGHTILVEDMKFKNRDGAFSAFVTIDQTTGRPNYTRHNPETGEILDFLLESDDAHPHTVNLVGIESPGVTCALPLARRAVALLVQKEQPQKNESFHPVRPVKKRFHEMSHEEQQQAIKENPLYGEVVCRCETVTKAEILDAIRNPLGVCTVTGIKNRTRATMGRCQGGYCETRITEMIEQEKHLAPEEVRYSKRDSYIFTGKVRDVK